MLPLLTMLPLLADAVMYCRRILFVKALGDRDVDGDICGNGSVVKVVLRSGTGGVRPAAGSQVSPMLEQAPECAVCVCMCVCVCVCVCVGGGGMHSILY